MGSLRSSSKTVTSSGAVSEETERLDMTTAAEEMVKLGVVRPHVAEEPSDMGQGVMSAWRDAATGLV
jgi:hypothetical protein